MSIELGHVDGAPQGEDVLIARATAADGRACLRQHAMVVDLFLSSDARLIEQDRRAALAVLEETVANLTDDLAQRARQLLVERREPHLAQALERTPRVFDRLRDAGLLRDVVLVEEVVGRVRLDRLAATLPPGLPDAHEQPSLLARLADGDDIRIASAAMALMMAESRTLDTARRHAAGSGLPADLHARLAWWTAAALRVGATAATAEHPLPIDAALTDAVHGLLAGYDEGERTEAVATRLATALAVPLEHVPDLLVEVLTDRRASLFVALLAHALGIGFGATRGLLFDAEPTRLWLALRAIGAERQPLARIALALSEADPAYDIELFAEGLDALLDVIPDIARAALSPLAFDPDYRAAVHALGMRGAA